MGLEMRTKCERCGSELSMGGEAYICSYECTFCENCSNEMKSVCPNCGGRTGAQAPAERRGLINRSDQSAGRRTLRIFLMALCAGLFAVNLHPRLRVEPHLLPGPVGVGTQRTPVVDR